MAGQYVAAKTIAKLLDLTTRRLQQLVNEGVIPRFSRGRYELVPVVQAYVRYLRDHHGSEVGGPPGDPSRQLTEIKVQRARMDLAKEQRTLVNVDVLGHYAEQLGQVMHSGLEALPGQLKQVCPHLRTGELKQIRVLIKKLQNNIAAFDVRHPRVVA